ncbi:MAG: hypothetical protein ACT6U0_27325 [Shinella sp.]|uniref:hypothetical protein n=1 Tax=Shinella sp. TaxID=1870904 RepID=UPI004036B9D6
MNRRTVLKGGIVFAATSHTFVSSPQHTGAVPAIEDPREEVQRLSRRISDLLDSIEDYERVVIQAKSTGPWAIYTDFTV